MKIGIVITMYDEFDVVRETIVNAEKSLHDITWVVVHSDNGGTDENLDFIKHNTEYIVLESLGGTLDKYELPSASVVRNYNVGFEKLYSYGIDYDIVIGMTADSLITNLDHLLSVVSYYDGYVLQAIGQNFHARTDDPKNGIEGHRHQSDNTTDIMPQFFMIKGRVAIANKLFTCIENLNRFTSEENLGNELLRAVPQFRERILRLHNNANVYDYHAGIALQVKGLGHTRVNL